MSVVHKVRLGSCSRPASCSLGLGHDEEVVFETFKTLVDEGKNHLDFGG
jgi:hypothetical protein